MLAERPIVATDVGSVTEALTDGETGLIVGPDDPHALAAALRRVLADPDFSAALGRAAGRSASERFTAQVMAGAYERLYARVRVMPGHLRLP
jgi:glycosyltransferase involved in cell wall biosynthesis